MSKQSSNVPTCATYDQYVESQLINEFIANNLPSSEGQQKALLSNTFPSRVLTSSSLAMNAPVRLGSMNVITAATPYNDTTRHYHKKIIAVKYAKQMTRIALLSQRLRS